MLPLHHHDLRMPAVIHVQDQMSGMVWFGTYWDANLENVSVATLSSVTFASISLNARLRSGVIWSYTQ
jgi:hypothetical protein